MNDLSNAISDRSSFKCNFIPTPVLCILITLFFAGFGVSIFIFLAVRNAVFFVCLLLLSLLVSAFLIWNACLRRREGGILLFLSGIPDSDLQTASHGQLVKITGLASCGNISLESSYEKVPRCVYTSTLLYECLGFGSKPAKFNCRCFQWSLAYSERFATDFYITDVKTGVRAMVKAGHGSKVTPLVGESTLVSTTRKIGILSSYLRKWLCERNISAEARLLRLDEGYVKEGSFVTVMGMLCKENDVVMIVQPPEPISIGCLWLRCLLPNNVDGLILKFSATDSVATPYNQESGH
ncbi:hypothetical protein MRB53_025722 [Persea americana]|uniref:Uncharacterized protein n=1 Tax=Persea americana TaxID=3435 RepID=A0ACC2LG33_PERAE|nr:hypothetical protein MRB53_025722 [Persea americana]|eukprot:TRINITY_DN42277_c0_g1_i1.p1 TRINITY_DN42277_c0_g1~~TRINITY_DN42277_c0_g1_i1.p1  ORF type:complete len:295 (-),score=38.89 TRINITY_DN42277_c0_g1_i1:166-1050(-)